MTSYRNIDAKALTRTQTNLHDYFAGTPAKLPLTPYFPRVDKESENPFMPEFGNEMLKKGDFQKVSLASYLWNRQHYLDMVDYSFH